MENFVQLHCHSCFSVYDAISTPETLVQKAVEHGHSAIAITDHGALGACFRLQKAALKSGVKPLLGMEGYIVDNLITNNEKGKRIRTPNGHIILIAKNEIGWKNLLRLNYLSNSDDEHFYYKPRFTFDELIENHEGLICSTACLASPIARLLLDDKEEEAEKKFQTYMDIFKDDLYAEVQLNEVEGQHIYDNWLINQANKHGIPIVITGDVHYAEKDGYLTQKLAFAIRNESENEVGQEFAAKSLYYHGIDDYKDFNKRFGYNFTDEQIEEWCGNTKLVESKVNFLIPERTKMHLPRQAFDENQTLIDKAKEGLAKHFNCKYEECPKEYVDRLEYELKLMWKKGIARYILCLSDICNWCDGEGHVSRGVGRGCFLPDNLVTMSDGSKKKISEVRPNDKVIAGFGKKANVDQVFIYDVDEDITDIKSENGNITCTQDHRVLVVKKGLELKKENAKYIRAHEIEPGDHLVIINEECDFVEVKEVDNSKHYKGNVFDLSIHGDDHSYKINDCTVHNSACGSLVLACVGITGWAIDPIKNGLLFERFVSESRLPDVMIDYSKSGNGGK